MSLKIIGSRAKVHWLSNTPGPLLSKTQGILYVSPKGLGQVTRATASGLTPSQVFEHRYASQKSSLMSDFVADDIIVFDTVHGDNYDYDDVVRALINQLYVKGRIPFNANYNTVQVDNTNSEALLGYNRKQHFNILLKVTKQALNLEDIYDTRDPITWRWQQMEDAVEVVDTLRQHELCLYAAYTSRGKTKISMEVAAQLLPRGGVVLVTTPIVDTKDGFAENIRDWHFGTDRSVRTTYIDSVAFAKTNINELHTRARSGERIFIVLTVQDLRYGEESPELTILREKYVELSRNIDLWIRDERHAQYNGEITAQRLEGLVSRYYLDLTATPYNVLDKYQIEQVVSRTLIWGLRHRVKTHLPRISIDIINTPISNISTLTAAAYSTEEGYDPRKLFVREDGNFLLEAELIKIAEAFYHNTRSKRKNPLSIVSDTGLDATAKNCGMWVLPQGQDGDSAKNYIPKLAQLLNSKLGDNGTYYIDSYTVEELKPKHQTIAQFINEGIAAHGRVVILTCGKFLTGTDIPALGHIVLMDKIGSTALFEQLMGRMIREYPGKDRVKLYTLVPGNDIKMILGSVARANVALTGGTEYEMLECIPLTEYDLNNARNSISPEDILDAVAEFAHEQLRARVPSNSLLASIATIDTALWDTINTSQYRSMVPGSTLSETTGSRVRVAISNAKRAKVPKKSKSKIEQIADTIQVVMGEARWVAYTMDNYNYREILASELMNAMFDHGEIAAVIDTANQSKSVDQLLDNYLLGRKMVYERLPYEEVYAEIFANSRLKQKAGLVYLDSSSVEFVIEELA